MEQKRLCPYCMGELPHAADSCVHCGKVFAGRNPAGCLPVGTAPPAVSGKRGACDLRFSSRCTPHRGD